MISYVEIIDKYNLKPFTLIEPSECWFELSYFDVGEFELYCNATPSNLKALQKGHYVKIPNKRFIWVITSIQYTFNASGTRMISAKGREAKYLLNKRIIQTPRELSGTITSAVYGLVNENLGTGANAARKINGFNVATNELLIDISGTQAPRGNLLEFVTNLLKTYNCGSQVIYENGVLKFQVLNGEVKTNTVKFSQSLDNLLSSEYLSNNEDVATNAYVVSTVEEVDYPLEYDTGKTGIDRAEIYISSNLSTKYEDASGVEQETTPTSNLYKGWQQEEAKNELSQHKEIIEVKGEIDLTNCNYVFDIDYYIGDLVRIMDEHFNYYADKRILKYTFSQDSNGYAETADYGE